MPGWIILYDLHIVGMWVVGTAFAAMILGALLKIRSFWAWTGLLLGGVTVGLINGILFALGFLPAL